MSKEPKRSGKISPEQRSKLAALGGAAVPSHKRTFYTDPQLAARAGAAGGKASAEAKRRRKLEQEKNNG